VRPAGVPGGPLRVSSVIGVSVPVDPRPNSIPTPRPVVVAALLVFLEAAGLLLLSVATLVSGLTENIAIGRTFAQFLYYVVLALLLAICANALVHGRRWGRTPCLVAQVVLAAVGVWLIAPSGQYVWGIALLALGGVTGYLLLSRPANAWISSFPLPFAEDPSVEQPFAADQPAPDRPAPDRPPAGQPPAEPDR
jgi:hypothetical protein